MKKTLKRIAALLLAFVMTLGLAACGGNKNNETDPAKDKTDPAKQTESPKETDAPKSKEIGFYELTEISGEGAEEMLTLMQLLGLRAFVVLEEGGTGFINLFGEEREITWKNGKLSIAEEDGSVAYELNGDKFVMEQQGETMTFTRGKDEDAPKRGEYKPSFDPGGETESLLTRIDEIIFTEQVLLEGEGFRVTAKEIEPESDWGYYVIKVLLENDLEDKDLRFRIDHATVNGVTADPLFSEEVAAGKKANEEIEFDLDTLLEAGVGDPTVIEMVLEVVDSDDYFGDPLAQETVRIYPLGEDKAEIFVREPQATDIVLVDTDECTVIVTGFDPDGLWGYTMKFYLVNKSDAELSFTMDEVSVNGFMIDPYFWKDVAAGCVAFGEASWSDSKFEENGIETVEKIEFELKIRNEEDWSAEPVFDEVLTVEP